MKCEGGIPKIKRYNHMLVALVAFILVVYALFFGKVAKLPRRAGSVRFLLANLQSSGYVIRDFVSMYANALQSFANRPISISPYYCNLIYTTNKCQTDIGHHTKCYFRFR